MQVKAMYSRAVPASNGKLRQNQESTFEEKAILDVTGHDTDNFNKIKFLICDVIRILSVPKI